MSDLRHSSTESPLSTPGRGCDDGGARPSRWPMSRSTRTRLILACFAFCMVYLVPVFPHFRSANEFSRWVTAAGLVEHGTLEASWSTPLLGVPMDVSRRDTHLYSNKAPGLNLLTLPAYLLARPLVGPPRPSTIRWSMYAVRLIAVSLPALLLGLLVARSCRNDPFAVATVCFATPLFVYSALLFSHVAAAACLYAAYLLALRLPRPAFPLRRDLVAGVLCGLATVTEYPAALGTILLGLTLLVSPARWRRLAAFVTGGLPFAAALAIYDKVLFGSWTSLSSANEAYQDLAAQAARGMFGIHLPSLAGVANVLASPSRGLLFFAPVLVLGLVALVPRRGTGPASWFRLFFVLALVGSIAGYEGWNGGWGAGARYLILAVPFLVEAAYDRGARSSVLGTALLSASIVLCVLPVLTFPLAPTEFTFLHATFTLPLLRAGFATPNLGNLLLDGPSTLLPILLATAVAVLATWEGRRWRCVLGTLLGVAAAASVVLLPIPSTADQSVIRALILDTHFRPEQRLQRTLRETSDPRVAALVRSLIDASAMTRKIGPDDWPYDRRPSLAKEAEQPDSRGNGGPAGARTDRAEAPPP
jgi:hypothetical protein